MARLQDPVTVLKGVGTARAKQFAQLNIFTLVLHFILAKLFCVWLKKVLRVLSAKLRIQFVYYLPHS